MGEVGDDDVAGADGGLLGGAHHERDVGAVDVRVDEADALTEAREGDGEVDGDGGLSDSALAGTYGNDLGDAGDGEGGGHIGGVGHCLCSSLFSWRRSVISD